MRRWKLYKILILAAVVISFLFALLLTWNTGNSNKYKDLRIFEKIRSVSKKQNKSSIKRTQHATLHSTHKKKNSTVNFNLHIFYYPWYGNPEHDQKYIHWNHPFLPHWDKKEAAKWPSGIHQPPDDIGANFYPKLGPYSSKDPLVLQQHMKDITSARVGKMSLYYISYIFCKLIKLI